MIVYWEVQLILQWGIHSILVPTSIGLYMFQLILSLRYDVIQTFFIYMIWVYCCCYIAPKNVSFLHPNSFVLDWNVLTELYVLHSEFTSDLKTSCHATIVQIYVRPRHGCYQMHQTRSTVFNCGKSSKHSTFSVRERQMVA